MIEKVGYTKPLSPARAAAIRRAGSADGAAFAEALARAEGASTVDAPAATAPIASSAGLLGLQEVSEEELRRQKSVKMGRLTLDALAQLRDALLIGVLPIATLQNLERMIASERALTLDPQLESIMNEIETRAAVEIAKLQMSGVFPPTAV